MKRKKETDTSRGRVRRRFICGIDNCGKAFTRREHLGRHRLNHLVRPDITCMTCRAHFKRPDLLDRHIRRHEQRDREAGGPGRGRLVTRKRSWLGHDGRITTSRPTTPSAAAARASIGPQEGKSHDSTSGEDAACGTGGDGGAAAMPPQPCMGLPTQEGTRGARDGRSESRGNCAPSQFQQQGDSQEEGEFGGESSQLSSPPPPSQDSGMGALVLGAAAMSLTGYERCYWEPFSADNVSDYDMSFTTLDTTFGAEPTYATDVAEGGRLLEVPVGEEFLYFGHRGLKEQQQTNWCHDLQSLAKVLERNEVSLGEGCRQRKSYCSSSEIAHEISLDIPPVDSLTGTVASPDHQSPDLGPWTLPTPHTQYSTNPPDSTLDFTQFAEPSRGYIPISTVLYNFYPPAS